ncbi:uncharacterized protein LOC114765243 [Denticeps clupeoides]|uniref:uncharacterized protein LOC114765243 n=1 Tax=Denticeps clupeoides TaxID=299321 RepID=UPI0010A2E4B0|nr:uncharacterized protein LOC114765243 [Denticeps clupeoides]
MTLQGLSVETNGDLLLCPNISGDKEHILWIHNGNKMVEWDKMGQEISESPQFKNRTQLNTETGDVTVTGVTTADSGLYTAEISIGGQIETFTQQVNVIDPVRNTRICCNYSWSGAGLQNPENMNQIQISRENLASNYTCVVKNQVSEEKWSYTAVGCSAAVGGLAVFVGNVVGLLTLLICLLGLVNLGLTVYKRLKSHRDPDEENHQLENPEPHLEFQPLNFTEF